MDSRSPPLRWDSLKEPEECLSTPVRTQTTASTSLVHTNPFDRSRNWANICSGNMLFRPVAVETFPRAVEPGCSFGGGG